MRVARLDTRIVDIPVQSPYVFSHGVLKAFSNVLVWIHADGGAVGIRRLVRSRRSVSGGDARKHEADDRSFWPLR
jgi:hypothetical protein